MNETQILKNEMNLNVILPLLGFEPLKANGKSLVYKSPFNQDEKTPSFTVLENGQGFKDFSTGQKGNVIDFVQKFFSVTVPGAFQKLRDFKNGGSGYSPTFFLNQQKKNKKIIDAAKSHYTIKKIQEPQNKAILDYLYSRGIKSQENIKKYLREVYYHVENEEGNKKSYFAVTLVNDMGGMPIRNPYFKANLGKAHITTIKEIESDFIKVFEGFIDFMSYKEIKREKGNYIILNSVSHLSHIVEPCRDKIVLFYGDNDRAGNEAINSLRDMNLKVIDQRKHYKNYKDLNDKILGKELS